MRTRKRIAWRRTRISAESCIASVSYPARLAGRRGFLLGSEEGDHVGLPSPAPCWFRHRSCRSTCLECRNVGHVDQEPWPAADMRARVDGAKFAAANESDDLCGINAPTRGKLRWCQFRACHRAASTTGGFRTSRRSNSRRKTRALAESLPASRSVARRTRRRVSVGMSASRVPMRVIVT